MDDDIGPAVFFTLVRTAKDSIRAKLFVESLRRQVGRLRSVFLHQAVLSALTDRLIPSERLLTLPPQYSYPYNLHAKVPCARMPRFLNDLMTVVYEGRSMRPEDMTDIVVLEPLRSWLSARVASAPSQ